MNKSELVSAIAKLSSLKNVEAERALDAFIESVTTALKSGDEVRLLGFGTFAAVHRPASQGRNPKTGEKIDIPEKTIPKFKPGKGLKDAL